MILYAFVYLYHFCMLPVPLFSGSVCANGWDVGREESNDFLRQAAHLDVPNQQETQTRFVLGSYPHHSSIEPALPFGPPVSSIGTWSVQNGSSM